MSAQAAAARAGIKALTTDQVAVIGAGPAGLMAAEVLAQGGASVTVYDAMPSAGRKFLMAGRGGLNLTHSEPLPAFLARYREATPHLARGDRGVSAGGVARLERGAGAADLRRLQRPRVSESVQGLALAARVAAAARCDRACSSRCAIAGPAGTRTAACCFKRRTAQRAIEARATVLALGGASWPRLGSDGAWAETLAAKGVAISPLRPANCGFTVAWSDIFRDRFEGQPLKGVALTFGAHTRARRSDRSPARGIEGGAIYALSAELREADAARGQATLQIALRPDLDTERSDRAAVGAKGQTIAVEFPAQGRASVAGRASACCRRRRRHPACRCRRCRRPIWPT